MPTEPLFDRARMDAALATVEHGVRDVMKDAHLPPPPSFRELMRKELAYVPDVSVAMDSITHEEINRLYELRSQLLDWTTETGFLGFFDSNPGRRYIYRRRMEVLLEMIPDLQGKRVLEIGCASGILASVLAPACREYVGIDVTPTAMEFAKKLSRALKYPNTQFLEGDAHKLPFPDRSF